MKDTELTAILTAILYAELRRSETLDREGEAALAVDRAEMIIAETLKPKQQRDDEREARKVSARLKETAAKQDAWDEVKSGAAIQKTMQAAAQKAAYPLIQYDPRGGTPIPYPPGGGAVTPASPAKSWYERAARALTHKDPKMPDF